MPMTLFSSNSPIPRVRTFYYKVSQYAMTSDHSTAGGNSPNYETLFCDGLVGPPLPTTGHFITTEQVVISPQAR